MAEKRRDFLKNLTAALALPALSGFVPKTDWADTKIDHSLVGEEFWNQLRVQFPLTKDRVYFNNGTFGPAPYRVQRAIESSLTEINNSGEYGNTDAERQILASFLGIKTSELSLTHNTTEGINVMAWGISLKKGDEVILTNQDHAGNALPWLNRAKIDGIVLKAFSPASTQEENLQLIQSLVTPKTKVIAIPHVTCTTGLVFPIREIANFARSKGVLTAIDGAHGAGTFDLNLSELGCDCYAGCCHKWLLGPAGTGFLYVREEMLDQLRPLHLGAHGDLGWDLFSSPPTLDGYVATAHRYDYGTQSTSLMKGVSAGIAFHLDIGKAKVESRLRTLNQQLFEGLSDLKGRVEILSPTEQTSRISMVTFRPKNKDYQVVGQSLGTAGFRVRQVPEGRTDGIRISTHIYNSKEDIERFLRALPGILG